MLTPFDAYVALLQKQHLGQCCRCQIRRPQCEPGNQHKQLNETKSPAAYTDSFSVHPAINTLELTMNIDFIVSVSSVNFIEMNITETLINKRGLSAIIGSSS